MDRPRLSRGWRLTVLAAAILSAAPASGKTAEPLLGGAVALPCATDRIDVGEPAWRWALAEGVFDDEVAGGRSFAWTGRAAALLLVLGDEAPEAVEITARSVAVGQRLSAVLDGTELGARPVPVRWSEVRWTLPEELAAPGIHLLELRTSAVARVPPDPRTLGVAIDGVRLLGVEGCGAEPRRVDRDAERAELPPGGFLLVRSLLPPSAAVEVAGQGRAGSRVRLFALSGKERVGPIDLAAVTPDELDASVPLDVCCRRPAAVALHNGGGEGAVVSGWAMRGEWGAGAWRRACGLLPWEVTTGVLLLAGLLVARSRWRLPFGRYAPWLDLAIVLVVAFALRALFLQLYPEIGRAGDTYEYVTRARRLAAGRVPFLASTDWHAWQTWLRPPGFYLFLAGVLGPLGATLPSVLWWNAVFSSIAAGATYVTGYALFGRGAGLVAGLFLATYLEAIVTVSRILSEPLYMVLLTPGLALLAACSRRPSWRLAGLAGVLFGAAALVRSAPVVFVPLAALLLLAVHGPRRSWRSALALTGGMALLVVPWSVRNSLVRGTATGVDDLAVINLLQVRPDQRFVPYDDVDLATEEGARIYYSRLQRANADARLARQGGAVLARNLWYKARHPGETLATIAGNLGVYFSFYQDRFFLSIHGGSDRCRVALLTDAMNFQYLLLLALGAWGMAVRIRDRAGWPLVFWLVLNVAVIVVFFHAEPKYRLPTLPVLMVFAGAVVADGMRVPRRKGEA